MLILSKDLWWQQWWFKIKMALVALLILNGILIGNKQGSKLRKLIADNGHDFIHRATHVKSIPALWLTFPEYQRLVIRNKEFKYLLDINKKSRKIARLFYFETFICIMFQGPNKKGPHCCRPLKLWSPPTDCRTN
jgi:hypothetical protein